MKSPNIALIGGMGSGKSTILGRFCNRYGYQRMSWADPVKELARQAYGRVEKHKLYEVSLPSGIIVQRSGREILQRIGTDALREQVDADFWVRAGLNRMDTAEKDWAGRRFIRWVNDDSRFPNEIDALRSRGFAIVRLVVPNHVRAERLGISDEDLDKLSRHPSEELIASLEADIEIQNLDDPDVIAERILLQLADLIPA